MTSLQGNFGWMGPAPIDILATNRSTAAVAVGAMLMLDVRRIDGDSTSNTSGLQTAGLANGVVPDVAGAAATLANASVGIFGICLQAAADNQFLKLRLAGQCDNVAVAGTVVLATDEAYGPADGSTNVTKLTAEAAPQTNASHVVKCVFIPLTARTNAGLTDGWFDGVGGFGFLLTT